MIYKFDHLGITVRSLQEARAQIEAVYPCFHAQYDIRAKQALREVSIHKPERLSISLHRKNKDINIELIEYPRVSAKTGSILPWRLQMQAATTSFKLLKDAVREQLAKSLHDYCFADIAELLARHAECNAAVVPVTDLSPEVDFWRGLRFNKIYSDDDVVILSLKSLIPPSQEDYVILYKVDFKMEYHTDTEGINEIALLCHSSSEDMKAFARDVFKSGVDTFLVDGKEVKLGYLRSPSGVLVELLSVRLNAE